MGEYLILSSHALDSGLDSPIQVQNESRHGFNVLGLPELTFHYIQCNQFQMQTPVKWVVY